MPAAAAASARIEKYFANLTVVVREREERQEERRNGPEGQSDRAPARHQPHLGLAAGSRARITATLLHEDLQLRKFLTERLQQAGVARIVIERAAKKTRITIHSARPGVVIGKKGADIEKLRVDIAKMTEQRGQPQHRRDPQARDRRQADRRRHRPAARAPRRLPPRHEARRAIGDAARRARASASTAPAGSAAPRSRAWSGIAKAACRCTRCAPMSISATARPRRPTAPAASRSGCSRARSWRTTRWRRTSAPPKQQPRRRASERPTRIARTHASVPSAPNTARRIRAASTAWPRAAPTLNFGAYGLKAIEPGRVTARQIEAARRAITRHIKRVGRVWIRIFPDVPVSQKPAEVRMGSGKGTPEFWVCRVKPGRIMFELDGVPDDDRARGVRRWPRRSCRSAPAS